MTPGEYAMGMFKSLHRFLCTSATAIGTSLTPSSITIHVNERTQTQSVRVILFPDGTYKIDGEIRPEMEKLQP